MLVGGIFEFIRLGLEMFLIHEDYATRALKLILGLTVKRPIIETIPDILEVLGRRRRLYVLPRFAQMQPGEDVALRFDFLGLFLLLEAILVAHYIHIIDHRWLVLGLLNVLLVQILDVVQTIVVH